MRDRRDQIGRHQEAAAASDQEQGAAQTGHDEQDDDGDEADHDSGTAALG